MRPEILNPLFVDVTSLKGVGPGLGRLIEKAAGKQVVDLVWHLPTGLIDRRNSPSLAAAVPGEIVTVTVTIEEHLRPGNPRHPYRIRCTDGTATLMLVYFHVRGDWLEKALPVGAERVISGRIESFNGQLQMSHPDHVALPGEADFAIEPVYRLTTGLSLKLLRRAIEQALQRLPPLPEWLDPAIVAREGWPGWRDALLDLHHPEAQADLDPQRPARRRLAYDELLADQLALGLMRATVRKRPGRVLRGTGGLQQAVIDALPYRLTGSQHRALDDIQRDLGSGDRMLRLLQGDVGSGKTIVALLAMLTVVEAGAQAVMMAPTELLARQHHATLRDLAAPVGVPIALLTGRDKGRARDTVLAGLADGSIPIVVGTHALFQQEVAFHNLAFAVVDEQHRFGVEQRTDLASKGSGVAVLAMTATPIPRTLMLTSYGDLDASLLTEKPAGRQPIRTRLVSSQRLDEVADAIGRALDGGSKVYWVCPLIEESEASDVAAVEARHSELRERFGPRVGLLHGRMKPAERDRAMGAFATGGIDLLVATTVIEVGVDVPSATIMVVEHAERFGLAQLHQLRGRIGRGRDESTCLLVYAPPLGETARARLETLRATDDGFRIAEEDLRLRGAGEVLGTRQSGLPEYRVADVTLHGDLLDMAHDEARLILHRDPELAGPRGAALRTLLYLFRRDAAVRWLRSG
ncbi:MAG TPA: ATP-dependent DNA helicase RecG [Stellaceae bacterium]|nr:ATP-dependent DNA helicase RecG [Stellaceae bacterium]